MKRTMRTNPYFIVVVSTVVAAGIFILDLLMPLGVAGGIPYVTLVLISLYSPWRYYATVLASVSTALIVLGYFLSSPLGILWVVIANRLLAVFVVWVTARFCMVRTGAEEELKRSEYIVSSSDDLMALLDPNFVYIYVNQKYGNAFGKDRSEFIGNKVSDVFGDKFFEVVIRPHGEKCLQGHDIHFHDWFDFPAIGKQYMEVSYSPYMGHDGKVEGIVVNARDVTERKKTEEALRDSENSLVKAQKLAQLGHYDFDTTTGTWTSSVELDNIFWIDDDFTKDVEGWLQVVHPDYKDIMLNYLQVEVIGKRHDFDKIYKILNATTGQEKWVHVLGKLKYDADNKPIQLLGTVQDITKQKQSEDELISLAHIVEHSLNEIYICDAETLNFIQVNRGARENIGYTFEELKRLTPLDINPEITKESFLQLVEPLRKNVKEILRIETVHKRKDGSLYDVEVHVQYTEFLGKSVFVAMILDITETKRLLELESRAGRLETAGVIAGQVAHDFNNLLAPMMAYPEFIREELPSDHPALVYLDQIEEASRKITEINQDLLAMGRRGHFNREVLNINEVIRSALEELKPYSETLTCDLNLSDELMDVNGGSAQLHRMISNLLHNASDAMQNVGRITITTENYYVDDVSIVYGMVPKGEYVKLTISDTGCGIPDDIIQKIFDPFFTSKTADKKRGSGLGLSVVDSVLKDHGGYIDLSTKVDEGTSFYVYLPITRKAVEIKPSSEIIGGNENIFVVDDDDIQLEVSTRLLERLGYEVSSANSGEKAVECLRDNPHELIVLDMVMPDGIDGAETYQQILEFSPNQKAIILSGFSGSDRVLEAQKMGAGAFVRKPVTKSIIAAAVRKEIDRPIKIVAL